MTSLVIQSRTGPDGTLRLDVQLGTDLVDREVRIVIEPLPKPMTQEEWVAYVQSMAGKWEGDFERPPQCMRCNDEGTTQP